WRRPRGSVRLHLEIGGRMHATRLPVGLVCVLASCASGADGLDDPLAPAPAAERPRAPVGGPLPGLTSAELARFQAGRAEFMVEEEAAEGLGPVFNEASCVACHGLAAPGGAGNRLETRFGKLELGVFDPMPYAGGSLLQDHATACTTREYVPVQANVVAQRRTTALFGLGLVDAVPDDAFERLAAQEAANGIAGHVSHVTNLVAGGTSVGKFGWKAGVPSLLQFAGDAYLNEMGITSPRFMSESCPQGDCTKLVGCDPLAEPEDDGTGGDQFADFMTMLAAPPRAAAADDGGGGQLFESVRCAGCHTPTMRTGASPIAALDPVTLPPYGDLLLHHLG